ncbi:MAG: hypothetical protein WCI95_09040 [bacterium]
MHRENQPTAQRNADILRMGQEGVHFRDIASQLNISSSRVHQIFKKEKERYDWTRRSRKLQRDCRKRNDIDRKMRIDNLFCMLAYPSKIRTVLGRYFGEQEIKRYSIRDMMEFLIPQCQSYQPLNCVMPACGIRGMGKRHYATLIGTMSSVDCGEEFQREWTGRKIRLENYFARTYEDRTALLSILEASKNLSLPPRIRKSISYAQGGREIELL